MNRMNINNNNISNKINICSSHWISLALLLRLLLSSIGFQYPVWQANASLSTLLFVGHHFGRHSKDYFRRVKSVANDILEQPLSQHQTRFKGSSILMPLQNGNRNEEESTCNHGDDDLSMSYYSDDDIDAVAKNRVPHHIGIVLDGNGRWARQRSLPVSLAHMRGADRVLQLIPMLQSSGVKCCTLYCFSTENWSRPEKEVMNIFSILEQNLSSFIGSSSNGNKNIRVKLIGSRDELPCTLLDVLDQLELESTSSSMQHPNTTTAATAATNAAAAASLLTICLAINYGGRRDLVDATKRIVQAVQNGEISNPSVQVNESLFGSYLSTRDLPDVDLIIRTGGEQRLSNFLLWNAAYAELYFTDVLWPDFDENCWKNALEWYASRERRFGGRKQQQ